MYISPGTGNRSRKMSSVLLSYNNKRSDSMLLNICVALLCNISGSAVFIFRSDDKIQRKGLGNYVHDGIFLFCSLILHIIFLYIYWALRWHFHRILYLNSVIYFISSNRTFRSLHYVWGFWIFAQVIYFVYLHWI